MADNDVTVSKTYADGKVDTMNATEMNTLYEKLNDRVVVTTIADKPANGEYQGQIYIITDEEPMYRCQIWFTGGWQVVQLLSL